MIRKGRARGEVSIVLGLVICFGLLSPAYGSEIIIQPVVAGLSTPDISRDLLFTGAIFAQASIGVEFLPTSYQPGLPSDLTASVPGYKDFLLSSSDQAAPILTVWYVQSITNSPDDTRGISFCLGGILGDCGIWISNVSAYDTVAHEIAHILTDFSAIWEPNPGDPQHSTDPTNLLASGSIRNLPSLLSDVNQNMFSPTSIYDRIDPSQAAVMLDSRFVQENSVPEPISLVSVGFGILLILSRRLRKG